MGTPSFVAPIFDRIACAHDVVAVFTRAPKPVGRKQEVQKSPVHVWAESRGIPVYTDIKEIEKAPRPDFIIVAAYGVILKQDVLDFAPCLNVHYSLLPKYRGANPVAAAILNGDVESGVCLQKMALELDTGDILMLEKFPIGENETTDEVRVKASAIAAEMLCRFLDDPAAWPPVPQSGEPTFAKKEIGADTSIDWKKSAREIHNQVRAIGGRATVNGIGVQILSTRIEGGELKIIRVQPDGKKPMSWADFMNGQRNKCVFD
jgi:methionyl-tRNA formyltransferase